MTTSAPSVTLSQRHNRVRAALAAASLDALVVTSLPNILYLSNFGGSAAILVIDASRVHLITDGRYVTSVNGTRGTDSECPGLMLETVTSTYDGMLVEVITRLGGRVGFEAAHLSVSRFDWLSLEMTRAGGTTSLVSTQGIVEKGRLRKDAHELAVLGEAGRRLSAVATEAFGFVRRGRTEREIAADIDWQLRYGGFDRPAFDTIVASGPQAALPHARPSERKIRENDLVVLDFGGVYGSYCVDLTRTVVVGRASERARQVHAAVLSAQQQAIAAVKPGASRFAVDEAARAALTRAGMGEAFSHGTGHGLGLEVHENPRVVERRPGVDTTDEALEVGMVFTVEPGAYFPGWGGLRIEDDIVVTEQGAEYLTHVTSELLER